MKTIKIDIKKEPWFLEKPEEGLILRRFKEKVETGLLAEGAKVPEQMVSYEQVRYQVEEVVRPSGKSEFYLVPVDDRNMFIDLINISNAEVERMIQKAIREKEKYWEERERRLVEMGRQEAKYYTKSNIKALPWWKRLFNQF
jgi:hypothetical protein